MPLQIVPHNRERPCSPSWTNRKQGIMQWANRKRGIHSLSSPFVYTTSQRKRNGHTHCTYNMHERFSSSVDVSFVLSTTKRKRKTFFFFSRLYKVVELFPLFYIKYIGKSILYRDSVHNNNSREWLACLCVYIT